MAKFLRLGLAQCLFVFAFLLSSIATAQLPSYTLFESDPVTPIALSPDGSRLFAVNTQEGRLEVREPTDDGRTLLVASVPVGLEPVSVAVRNNAEVWVVNQVSDSVSIVDVSADPPRVVRTLLVGDEPRGIVFAGPGGDRAFIATAHRGQNTPWPDGDYDVPGIGRADVWVFDSNNLGSSLEGNPLTVISLFGDRPRALTASPDGSTVYAAVFRSGNRTTAVSEPLVCDGAGPCNVSGTVYPAGRPFPEINFQGGLNRETGLIVGFNESNGRWEDETGNNWNPAVRFSLPDLDVFEIDADAALPAETRAFSGVGTVLFNMIVNPVNGNLYVTNTDANNRVRFEGPGDWVNVIGPKPSGDPPSVIGNLHQARVTVISPGGAVTPRHLNKHIPYGVSPVPAGVKERSVGTPLDMAVSSDGTTLYVVGFGSNAVAVFDTAQLENDTFVPDAANMFPVEGPTGLALDEARGFLWVTSTRGGNDIYSINLGTGLVRPAGGWLSPEPDSVKTGRKFLYDTQLTSSNGEASCSSCHIFGDMDDIAWDLGDPDGTFVNNQNLCAISDLGLPAFVTAIVCNLQPLDPLKGPMTTQSLRGMANAGPMHWRGDRTGAATGGDSLDEVAAFNAFNVAFPGLLGRDEGELDPSDMQAFTDFALQLTYPPNPIRALDNSLNAQETAGFNLYFTPGLDSNVLSCNDCHRLDRDLGFFGTNGGSTFETEATEFKVPHLRNAYQKVGMFGTPPSPFIPDADGSDQGDQIRAFGFLHDGSIDQTFDFLGAGVFNINDSQQRDLEAFIMAFDSNVAPIVGQQATVSATTGGDTLSRVDLLIQRADTTYYTDPTAGPVNECDLIVKGVVDDEARGWLYVGGNAFQSDDPSESNWSKAELLTEAVEPGQALTFTCVPPGSGMRMAIDRDGDSLLDGADMFDCSAGPVRPSHQGSLAVFSFLTLLGLAILRRRQRS
ncbi:MAG: hypothetical protein WBG86_03805 [Polyangiales bacterium]